MLAALEIIFATIGLTFIVTQSKIMSPIRKIGEKINPNIGYFLRCPMCFGFWAALITQLVSTYQYEIINYCFIGSFFSYLAYLLIRPLMDKYD